MKVTRQTHQAIRFQNIFFTLLFFAVMGLLAWLSTQYSVQSDWTANNRNSLSSSSIQLLNTLNKPVNITAYVTEAEVIRQRISELVKKYQRHKTDISLSFINPDLRPDITREEGITTDGELIIRYGNRRESLKQLDEQSLTNALQRLTASQQRWVVFLSGHGERAVTGKANFDLSLFNDELSRKGINSQTINLIDTPAIPKNTSLLVIADPKSALLPGEVELIKRYVESGKPLLWLAEPNSSNNNQILTELFGVSLLLGIVVDATTQMFGIDDPTYALVTEYPAHPVTQHLQAMSLYPGAVGLIASNTRFVATPLLATLERSWTETNSISGDIQFDANTEEKQGPIIIGFGLTRDVNVHDDNIKQRVAILGDADFLSNAFLGNGANLDVGLHLIQWLNHDDNLIDIPAKIAPDNALAITQNWTLIFGLGFLIVLPIAFIATGVIIWFKRKKR